MDSSVPVLSEDEQRKERQREYFRRYRQMNRERIREQGRKYHAENRDRRREASKKNYYKHRDKYRNHTLTRNYGITAEDYDRMLEAQNGVCAICILPCASGNRLAVDHDHATGAVRGLLCHRCNMTLGKYEDDPELFRRSADYLEIHKAKAQADPRPNPQGLP